MFFEKDLLVDSELRRVWRAGFGRMEEPEENTSFRNICTDLVHCIDSNSPDPRRRLSLRTSSVLVEGAARIYRQELSRLMEGMRSSVEKVKVCLTQNVRDLRQSSRYSDLSELDMVNHNRSKSTDSEADTSTDSSNLSAPCDTPELMRRQIPKHSDVSIQSPDNENIKSLEAPDLSHPLSSKSNSTNSQQSSTKDVQNGLSAKRRKMTDQRNRSSEYPSSSHLTIDRNSEDPISDEELDLADDNQNIAQISEEPSKDANVVFHSDDQATQTTDQNETAKSFQEENTLKSPASLTFTEKFDFVAAFPNFDPDTYTYLDKTAADKNCKKYINEADKRNKYDENVTIRKKIITADKKSSTVKHSNRSDVGKDFDSGRVDLSPILPSSARMVLRNSSQDVFIQRPEIETIVSLKTPDLCDPFRSISKSTNSSYKPRKDVENGLPAKTQKITDQTNGSSEYPSSPDLTTDRNSEDPITDEELDLADIQNILQISEQTKNNVNTKFNFDDQATRTTDHIETDNSFEEENTRKSPVRATFTEIFDFVFALPNYDPDTATPEMEGGRTNSMAYKNCEELINEADTSNEFEKYVNIRKKDSTDDKNSSAVKRSDGNDVVKHSDSGRVVHSPISPSTARNMLRISRRRTKNINKSVVKKDKATQTDDISFHPSTSERDRSANVNHPFGYLLIHDTYSSRYPSKIVLSSLNPIVRNL